MVHITSGADFIETRQLKFWVVLKRVNSSEVSEQELIDLRSLARLNVNDPKYYKWCNQLIKVCKRRLE